MAYFTSTLKHRLVTLFKRNSCSAYEVAGAANLFFLCSQNAIVLLIQYRYNSTKYLKIT